MKVCTRLPWAEAILLLLVGSSYLVWGSLRVTGDAVQYYALAEALVSTGLRSVAPEAYLDEVEPRRRIFQIHPWQGHPAILYPPGYAYVAWPALVLADAMGSHRRDVTALWSDFPLHRVLALTVWYLVLTGLALVLLYRALVTVLGVPRGWALIGVVAAYLGTPWWFYSTRQVLYSHAPELALLSIGLVAVLFVRRCSRAVWAWLLGGVSGFCWGLAGAVRYSAWVWAAAVGLAFLYWGRARSRSFMQRWAAGAVVGALPWFFVVGIYQARFFGDPLSSGYAPRFFAWHYPWREALSLVGFRVWAVWVHPVRGFLVWHPVALLAGMAWRRLSGLHRAWTLAGTLAVWGLVATYTDWWGGASCGQRLMLELAPGIAAALAVGGPFLRRWARVGLGLALMWNVAISLGYVGEAWKGYNDGRRGERFPVTHLVRRMVRDTGQIARRFRDRVWSDRLHPVRVGALDTREIVPPGVRLRSEVDHGLGLQFVTQHRTPETVHLILTVGSSAAGPDPAGWWWTAVTHARSLDPGAHAWHIRWGGRVPLIRIAVDGAAVALRRVYGNFAMDPVATTWDRIRIRVTILQRQTWTARTFTATLTWYGARDVFPRCRLTFRATGLRNRYHWTATQPGELWIWAWPYLERPWFQTVHPVRPGAVVPLPPRTAQVGRQPYRGRVITCFLPARVSGSGPQEADAGRSRPAGAGP